MGTQRFGEPALSDSGPSHNHHHIPYALPYMQIHHPSTSFLNHEGTTSFDFGELEEAIALQGVKIINDDGSKQHFGATLYTTSRPAATLEMFPSWPMRYQQNTPRGSSKSGEDSTDSGSAVNALSSTRLVEAESPVSGIPPDLHQVAAEKKMHYFQPPQMEATGGVESSRSGGSDAKQSPEKNLYSGAEAALCSPSQKMI